MSGATRERTVMANLIANEQCWIGFNEGDGTNPDGLVDYENPTAADVDGCVDLTDFLIQLTATTTGNTVPTPKLRSLFETNIPGTAAGQFSGDFYRDDEVDVAWDLLPRNTRGAFVVSRFGGSGALKKPIAGDKVEVWPIRVSSRAPNGLASNQAQMFTVTGAVHKEPAEDVLVT